MRVQQVTDEVRASAGEAHRRKVLVGNEVSTAQTIAETAVLRSYGRDVTVDDFRSTFRLDIVPTDDAGNKIRVMVPRFWPLRVYYSNLDVDVLVVANFRKKYVQLLGWLPVPIVEQAPIYFFEKDGKRISYAHEIDQAYLFPMPDEFDFTDKCEHLETWLALWDYTTPGWKCAGCKQVLYADEDRQRLEEQDRRLGFSDTVSKTT